MKHPIVIAHLLFNFGMGGGMENGVLKLVSNSDKSKYRHIVISFTPVTSHVELLTGNDLILYVIDNKSEIGNIIDLLKIMRKENVAVVHARGWPTMLESAMLRLIMPRLKVVFSFHGRSYQELSNISLKRKIFQVFLSRCFDQVVTLTQSMKDEIINEFMLPAERIKIIPNGVQAVTPTRYTREKGRKELGICDEDLVIGYVGRLDPVKNIEKVIYAFDKIEKINKRCWLIIAGEGDCESALKEAANKTLNHNSIIFTGFCSNVTELMQIFDVYVQASFYEGLSNTILEAMSVGLPIVCSNAGGNKDIITHGVNGYLFDCYDDNMICHYLEIILNDTDTRNNMYLQNIKNISQEYTIDQMIVNYEGLYSSL